MFAEIYKFVTQSGANVAEQVDGATASQLTVESAATPAVVSDTLATEQVSDEVVAAVSAAEFSAASEVGAAEDSGAPDLAPGHVTVPTPAITINHP